MSAIAIQHSGSSRGTYFPLGKTEQIFEDELREKTKKLPPGARDLIRGLRPYLGGNDLLWALHDLNRGDKHASRITAALRGGIHVRDVKVWGDRNSPTVRTLGPRAGRHMIRNAENNLVQADPEKQPPYIPGRVVFSASPAELDDAMEFMTTDPGADVEAQFDPAFDMVFRNVQGLEGQPVIAGLYQMRDLTQSIFLAFQRRFFP